MKKLSFTLCVMVLAIMGYTLMLPAGDLEPTTKPGSTMKTLDQIYDAVEATAGLGINDRLPFPTYQKVEQNDYVMARITGQTQGEIKGSCVAAGYEEAITVEDFSHQVISPRDAASGLPTGKRQHKPVTITKRIDKSTPLLMTALFNNENLPEVFFRFYRTSRSGQLQNYYTIQLHNANVSDYQVGPRDIEHISFTYQKITCTWEDGGITAEDDWETPVV